MFRLSLILTFAILSPVWADTFPVTIRVVDALDKPVAKSQASLFWNAVDGTMKPLEGKFAVTDGTGKATLTVDNWKTKRSIMVLTEDRASGGSVAVSVEDRDKEIKVVLGPTVKVKFSVECKELNVKPKWANTTVTFEGVQSYSLQNISKTAEFEIILPAGSYKLRTYGEDFERLNKPITVTADRSELDLGILNVEASPLAKLRGKPLPDWKFTEARGVKAETKIADYKGKWLLIEFWGHWCGPCVAGSLPELIGIYEDYAEHRDKFEIIAVHTAGAETFPKLDNELISIKKHHWQGKDLPFPILMDPKGESSNLYGIDGYPTGLLVNPEGKFVDKATAADLVSKLPRLPAAKVWARHRDLQKNFFWSYRPDEATFKELAALFEQETHHKVRIDFDAIKAAGLNADSKLPGMLIGSSVTLGSIEELFLHPHGLEVAAAPDVKELQITKRKDEKRERSYLQKLREADLNKLLDSNENVKNSKPLEITNRPLDEAVQQIGNEYHFAVAFDAQAMQSKALDPKARVNGTITPRGLRTSLDAMLKPLGLKIEVRSECVTVTAR